MRARAQALSEYGLIIGLIAVVAIGALLLLGGNIQNMLNEVAKAL